MVRGGGVRTMIVRLLEILWGNFRKSHEKHKHK